MVRMNSMPLTMAKMVNSIIPVTREREMRRIVV
jgi:hypothetical protein